MRYKRMARNIRKERDAMVTQYDGKKKREWWAVWSYPMSTLVVVDGVLMDKDVTKRKTVSTQLPKIL